MSIRIGNQIISGGKGGNGDTISNQNPSSEITKLYNWVGTIEEYVQQEIATLHPDWVCYIVDGTQIAPSHRVIAFQKPTAENNYTWYRLYDDGWVEQGGVIAVGTVENITITLPITMLNTDYTWNLSFGDYIGTSNLEWLQCAITDRTVNSFVVRRDNQVRKSWEVKGLYYQEEESGELLR